VSEQLLQQILAELQSTNQRLVSLESDISTIKATMATMATKEDIALLPLIQQAVIETNRNVLESSATIERIEEGQVRHDRILESLSMRSLEQETELRELKRIK
jgi:hypothetical protein